jgi:hypothetical protein
MRSVSDLAGGRKPPARLVLSAKRKEAYDRQKKRTATFVAAAVRSLRKGKRKIRVTPYSVAKETERLSKLPNSKVRKVSANAIRNNELCHHHFKYEGELVGCRAPARFPAWLRRLTRDELMELVEADRAWAADTSRRLIEAELELARLKARRP